MDSRRFSTDQPAENLDCFPHSRLLRHRFHRPFYRRWNGFAGLLLFPIVFSLSALKAQTATPPRFPKAPFIVKTRLFIKHTTVREFHGPDSIQLANGDILMAASWGRPRGDFDQFAAKHPLPKLYRSQNGGRTWRQQGPLNMEWNLTGMISDGGVSFLRLQDGRLAFLAHRHVTGLHGGGLPVISFSKDQGKTWTPARVIGEPEGVWYVMNDRLLQTQRGQLIVPVAHMPKDTGTYEGDRNLGLCFFSNDAGATWKRSRVPARLDDLRGMQEPCIAEIADNRLLMLARTGSGSLHASRSHDGGDTWSKPTPTTLTSACSSLTLRTLPDQRLIVFYNHTPPLQPGAFFPRTPLCYAVSADEGQSWSEPVVVDDEGMTNNDRQNTYPSVCFTKEGMLMIWSTEIANPDGGFGPGNPDIGGGKCAILAYPEPQPDN